MVIGMAKCKDCLHYEACLTFSKFINSARDVEKGCEHFKDRTEVVEVVHGRWNTDQVEAFSPLTEEPYLLDVLQCSVCGEYFDVSEARNYCPNCGAKMDK